jgi:hypothetical protein
LGSQIKISLGLVLAEQPPVTFQHHPAMPKAWGLPLPAGRFETKGAAEKLDAAGKSGGAWKRQLPPEAAGALVAGAKKEPGAMGKTAEKWLGLHLKESFDMTKRWLF